MKPSNQLQMNAGLRGAEVIVLGRVAGVVSQLAILDTHWTSSAKKLSGKGDKAAADDLGQVVRALEDVLVATQSDFGRLAQVFEIHDQRIRDGYGALKSGGIVGARLPPKEKVADFVALVDTFGGDLATATIEAAKRLASAERLAAERKNLNDGLSKLAVGADSDGDLTDEQWTDVHLIAMGAAIVLGAEAGLIVEAAAGLWDLIFG